MSNNKAQRLARQTARNAHETRMAFLKTEANKIVATGKCPDCGSPLVLNNSIDGWYQCAGYAALSHRQPEFKHLPKCSFQTFTK